MEVRFLGGAREIGRSAILVDDSLLLDYGMSGGNPPTYPPDVDPDAAVVSHGHLDHAGMVPALLKGTRRPPVHWTAATRDLTYLLAEDTLSIQGDRFDQPFTRAEIGAIGEVSVTHAYGEPFKAAGYEVTLYDAGHIPGSAHVLVDDGATRLFYTGDFNTEAQRLVEPSRDRPAADAVIVESTYADVTRPSRASIEESFVRAVSETIHRGGTVVVPAFAIGRTQEMMLLCEANDLECYVDGMGIRVTERLRHAPESLRDPAAFRRASGHARFVTGRDGQRRRIADQNTVIVTTAGMLAGGPAMTYVPAVAGNPTNLIAMTGYQVEGTPGRDLLDTGSAEIDGRRMPVSARVEQFDFSAHADRDGLLELLESYPGATILVNHGDQCERFAAALRESGYGAGAPARGEVVSL
ncbi:putative exonuclease of the beta-lactamase foldinvolved in RNA processing [Halanaeroarchaeum sp. HSR-CO]|uniref:MBL fold metallo-hydrolase n=1 Tax=Halanaeroarchaeum sp. HSR-CO TaxID=2866382 RepID=UPI00217D0FA5|nr:MBL fold metallo-hydrolase [Halanaeroarchaeum sp. HSR-CO]UWG46687.1 putative exonuclease of the beta-lactamase foldinvolved in RNA processing [Halanaeroarchaeum sp. HSR-CO]